MSGTVTLEQAMQYCGFKGETTTSYEKVKFFFHCVRQMAPAFEEFRDTTRWTRRHRLRRMRGNAIRDAVKERVRVDRRGGVHQSSDVWWRGDTDEEFAYNQESKQFG